MPSSLLDVNISMHVSMLVSRARPIPQRKGLVALTTTVVSRSQTHPSLLYGEGLVNYKPSFRSRTTGSW